MKNNCEDDGFVTPKAELEKHRAATEKYVESATKAKKTIAFVDNQLSVTTSTPTSGYVTFNDPVSHPSHYTQGKFEVIDVLDDWNLPFCLANTIKYIARYRFKKNPLEDLKKARWYLDHYITQLEKITED